MSSSFTFSLSELFNSVRDTFFAGKVTTTDTERVLVAGITLLAYCDSRLFLAVVLIALSRKIIGGSMANHPRA